MLGVSAAGVMLASPAGSLGLVASSSEAMRLHRCRPGRHRRHPRSRGLGPASPSGALLSTRHAGTALLVNVGRSAAGLRAAIGMDSAGD